MLAARGQARVDEAIRKNTEAGLAKPKPQEPQQPDIKAAAAGIADFRAQFEAEKQRQQQEAEAKVRAEQAQKMQPPASTLAKIAKLQESMDRAREQRKAREIERDKPKGIGG